jgi:hypothetical protein
VKNLYAGNTGIWCAVSRAASSCKPNGLQLGANPLLLLLVVRGWCRLATAGVHWGLLVVPQLWACIPATL